MSIQKNKESIVKRHSGILSIIALLISIASLIFTWLQYQESISYLEFNSDIVFLNQNQEIHISIENTGTQSLHIYDAKLLLNGNVFWEYDRKPFTIPSKSTQTNLLFINYDINVNEKIEYDSTGLIKPAIEIHYFDDGLPKIVSIKLSPIKVHNNKIQLKR